MSSISGDDARLRSLTFLYLCVREILDVDPDVAFDCLTEGGGDFGVDGLHISEEIDGEFAVLLQSRLCGAGSRNGDVDSALEPQVPSDVRGCACAHRVADPRLSGRTGAPADPRNKSAGVHGCHRRTRAHSHKILVPGIV